MTNFDAQRDALAEMVAFLDTVSARPNYLNNFEERLIQLEGHDATLDCYAWFDDWCAIVAARVEGVFLCRQMLVLMFTKDKIEQAEKWEKHLIEAEREAAAYND